MFAYVVKISRNGGSAWEGLEKGERSQLSASMRLVSPNPESDLKVVIQMLSEPENFASCTHLQIVDDKEDRSPNAAFELT